MQRQLLIARRDIQLLILSADVRLRAKNTLLAKMRPRRLTCGLRIRDGLKIISGSTNVFLASM